MAHTDSSPYRSSRAVRTVLALSLALTATLSHAAAARASCSSPPFEMLWTYPADGATDMPLNTDFWILTSAWGPVPAATLNGIALDEASWVSFGGSTLDLGMLEPNTDYVLALEFAGATLADGGMVGTMEIAFRTGTAMAAKPAAPRVADHTAVTGIPNDHACPKVIEAQDCFDTGQNTLISFNASDADDVVAWAVRGMNGSPLVLWPDECGAPGVFTYDLSQRAACFDVSAIGAGGVIGDATQYCPRAATVDAGAVDGGAVNMGGRDAAVVDVPIQGADAAVTSATSDAAVVDRSDAVPMRSDDAGEPSSPSGSSIETSGCSVSARGLGSNSASSEPGFGVSMLALLALAFRRAR